ncbi:MAG: bifunctional hydroxymethylpyrimidine kinase/phosphomethylpyrimidine kinase [Pseudomonadota bacterium]|nr:bifunctional hydroxymethylpyrimidine kinase/phosphomethylpyrimidine kinase [Pseudomonadota bacterium]
MIGRVLVVAGSDSGGGAGIQADIKAIGALGAYAATAVTALTAQNTIGVHGVYPVPADFIDKQIHSVLTDIGADCIKIGMLHESQVIEAVVAALDRDAPKTPIVVDPVMVAKGGAVLMHKDAVDVLRKELVPRASLLTPNIPEAEALTRKKFSKQSDMEPLCRSLIKLGAKAVLLKGGHANGPIVCDMLIENEKVRVFKNPRLDTKNTHGTGCTLSSSIAAGLAKGLNLEEAIGVAEEFLHKAIKTAPQLGKGHGPVNHLHTIRGYKH